MQASNFTIAISVFLSHPPRQYRIKLLANGAQPSRSSAGDNLTPLSHAVWVTRSVQGSYMSGDLPPELRDWIWTRIWRKKNLLHQRFINGLHHCEIEQSGTMKIKTKVLFSDGPTVGFLCPQFNHHDEKQSGMTLQVSDTITVVKHWGASPVVLGVFVFGWNRATDQGWGKTSWRKAFNENMMTWDWAEGLPSSKKMTLNVESRQHRNQPGSSGTTLNVLEWPCQDPNFPATSTEQQHYFLCL